jgi:hypothetical protein
MKMYKLELLELQEEKAKETGILDDAEWRERAREVYELELLAREVGQQGIIEDVELSERLKEAYSRSQTKETEISSIESDRELGIFLSLIEADVSQSGSLPDNEWLARAKASYISDRNKEITQQLNSIDGAINDLTQGCDRYKQLITQSEAEAEERQVISQIIRGSHYLLTVTERYLYPRRNWLQRKLYKKMEFLNFPKFRLEERIKTIRYIIDYLERSRFETERQNDIQKRRLEHYLKTLPVEACHLTEWLKERVGK